jgi:predicted nucleic acid-binding protein
VKVLVDTCVWSLALRRKEPDARRAGVLADLVKDGRVVMIGPIRQELLSGVRVAAQFERLRDTLAAFPDLPLRTEHFEKAAAFANLCRAKGVQGSAIDFLICAVAHVEELLIFTVDADFMEFERHLPLSLL